MNKTYFIIILLFPLLVQASQTRLSGLNGSYYVPDKEFDVLNINPAFLLDFQGMEVYSDNNIYVGYSKSENKNGLTSNNTNLPYISKNCGYFPLINSTMGILGKINNKFGVGFIYFPYFLIAESKNETIEFKNIHQTYDSQYLNESKNYIENLVNFSGLFAVQMGEIKLGFYPSYSIESSGQYSKYENRTNGVLRYHNKLKGDKNIKVFGLDIGALYDDNTIFGAKLGYKINQIIDNPTFLFTPSGSTYNYSSSNDFFFREDETIGSTIILGLLMQKKLSGDHLIRAVMENSYSVSTKEGKYNRNNYDIEKGLGSYDAQVKYFIDKTDTKDLNTSLWLSLINSTEENRFRFYGINFKYQYKNDNQNIDNDYTLVPNNSNQEYSYSVFLSSFSCSFAYGMEGRILSNTMFRAGFNVVLFSVMNTKYLTLDRWDSKENRLSDTITSESENIRYNYFSTLNLCVGLGFEVVKNLFLDISTGTVIGSTLAQFDYENLPYPSDNPNKPKNTYNSFIFIFNGSITFKF